MCIITEKKLQLNIARLCCHNFLSLVVFRLGGAGPPGPPLATPMVLTVASVISATGQFLSEFTINRSSLQQYGTSIVKISQGI